MSTTFEPWPAMPRLSEPDSDETKEWTKADVYFAEFCALYGGVLSHTGRWEGLSYILKDQLARESVGIIETGTCRNPGNWDGDGCATKVWDWLVGRKGGWAFSVDMDLQACQRAQEFCPGVHVICQDSVTFLRGWFPGQISLLYLDSCDYPEPIELRKASMMHQAAELASIYSRLPSGCLIASDDSFAEGHGKPGLTRRLLASFGVEPVLDSYIVVWRKP